MHLQSNQETQQYQMHYRYPSSHNQHGQQVGTHTSSFTSNPQANVGYSQHCVSTQNGMYPPQAGYHGNGSYGMSPASQNSGPTAPASYSISSGYNMRSDGHQNFQVAQNVTTQFQQASSVTTRNFQTNMTSPTYVVPNTPRQSQLLTTQDCHMQNNSQANMTPSTPMQSLLWTVQNNPQPSQNTAVISSKGLQISGQHQGNFNISVPYTNSHPAPTLPLQPSSDQRSQKQIHVISQHQPSDSMQYQQNVCMGELTSRGHAVQPTQNRANGHNLMQVSTACLDAPGLNCQILSGQILTGNNTSVTAVHTGKSLPFYMNNSTSLSSISLGLDGVVPSPYPSRALSQMTPCQNTRRATSGANSLTTRTKGLPPPCCQRDKCGGSTSVHTNQNNQNGDNLKRHGNGASNHGSSNTVYSAPLQQQNSSAESSSAASKLKQHPLLTYLLGKINNKNTDKICHKDTVTSLANVVHRSPNRSGQICRAVAVVPPISQQRTDGGNTINCDASSSLKIKDVWSLADEKQTDGNGDCSILKVPPSNEQASESNSHPKDVRAANGPAHEQSLVYPNRDSQSKQRENTAKEDAPKDKKIEDLDGLTKSAIAFRLGMVRKLVATMELREQPQLKKNKNAQDFSRSILNCYWAGSYRNYIETEIRGTFENILREAKTFDTEEDKQVFYGIIYLKQLISKYNITTKNIGCDTAMENKKSSWRNLSDESLDIDKELADVDFVKENFPSLLEKTENRDLISNIQPGQEKTDSTDILKMTNHSSEYFAQMCDDSQDLDPEPRNCPTSPDDPIVDIKLTVSPSENESKAVDSESVHQDIVTAMEDDPSSPSVFVAEQSHKSDKECPESSDEALLSMKITVLSMDELGKLSKLFGEDSSPICLGSDDSEVEFVNSCQSVANLCQVESPEDLSVLNREEKTAFAPSLHKTAKLENTEDTFLTDLSGKQKANRAKDSQNENYTLKHQHLQEENRQSTQSHRPSKHQVQSASRKDSAQTVQKSIKPPRLETRVPNPSPSGVKASSPISPSATIKKKTADDVKQSGLPETEERPGIERPSASLGKGNSIPSSTFQTLPSQKRKTESPKHSGNSEGLSVSSEHAERPSAGDSDGLTNITASSTQASLQLTKKSSISEDTTNVPDKKRHRHEAGDPTGSSRERMILKWAETSLSPETPKNSSARHKVMKSWEDSYVPTSKVRRQSHSEKRSSNTEVKNKAKNLPERSVQPQISSGKDKKEQRQSPGKEHQSKHKKHTKHRSFSLNNLRREAETRGGSKMSPQEKKKTWHFL
ncbi:hypothetical protein ACEWY4_002204 [Coilia grayii]|uniref:Uncharacterized protein n=1 Tax=Coilia grayii TaxID=363190 RepID=A0ABD1KVP4_9TELE